MSVKGWIVLLSSEELHGYGCASVTTGRGGRQVVRDTKFSITVCESDEGVSVLLSSPDAVATVLHSEAPAPTSSASTPSPSPTGGCVVATGGGTLSE